MEIITLLVIAVGGFAISWKIEQKRKLRVEKLLSVSRDITQMAENLSLNLEPKMQRIIMTIENKIKLRGPQRHSFVPVMERVVYTKQLVKTFYDPISRLYLNFTSPPKLIGFGADIDPMDLKVLLKEKERDKLISEFSDLMRQKKES